MHIDTNLENEKPNKSLPNIVFHIENNIMVIKNEYQEEKTASKPTYKNHTFWNDKSSEYSKKLWLPTNMELKTLEFHCLNGFSRNITQHFFMIKNNNEQMNIPYRSHLDDTNQIQYCRKVRFYPTTNHKVLLEKCFGATRYLINSALKEIKEGNIEHITNPISIRNHLRYQDKYLTKETEWLKEVPFDTREGAIRQLSSNFKTAFTQLKNKQIKKFYMKFKSKKTPTQVCFLNKDALNLENKTLFVRRVKEPIEFKENIDDFEFGNLTIVREKNKYYMCFPLKRDIINIETPYKSVALDPGVHTFQSFYSEEGIVGKIGDETIENLKCIYKREDKLKSKLDTNKHLKKRTRYNIRKRCLLLRTKVKNRVKHLHRMSCSWLTSTFKYIFLPSFNVKDMIKKNTLRGRTINKTTVRAMLALSHFAFKERLLHMAKSRGCVVNICSEAWTSKTCGCCGSIKNDLGGKRIYECSNCGISIDRDYNGARNIYLRNTQ